MPPENVQAIREAITAFREAGVHRNEIAKAIQHLWPGCTGNHVRGVFAGLRSKEVCGGVAVRSMRGSYEPIKQRPWRPGDPKPERNT